MSSEVNKVSLLVNAEKLLKTQGLAEFNMRTLAKECDISVGSVYNCFPSKNHLIFALMQKLLDECGVAFDSVVEDNLVDAILSCYRISLEFINHFKYNLMSQLVTYVADYQGEAVDRRQHMSVFYEHIDKLLDKFAAQLSESAKKFSMKELCEMTMRVFYSYIANNSDDFDQLRYIWSKMLID